MIALAIAAALATAVESPLRKERRTRTRWFDHCVCVFNEAEGEKDVSIHTHQGRACEGDRNGAGSVFEGAERSRDKAYLYSIV